MAKKRITKAELEQRDALGEKIVFICQEQIDILIKMIDDVAQFYNSNDAMTRKQFGDRLSAILPKFESLTKLKVNILNEYTKNKDMVIEKKNDKKMEANNGE
jgi:hypothetical protein